MGIPKLLFTYWSDPSGDGKPPPPFVRACMRHMREINPTWTFRCLTDDDVCAVPGLQSLSVQHRSDWARCCALSEYGGVWLDASVVCVRPIEAWVDMSSDSVQGFSASWDETVLENWAFAAPPRSAFMAAWKDELRKACRAGHAAYCQSIPRHVVPETLWPQLPYLTMHAAFCVVRARCPGLVTMQPSAAVDGPFHHLRVNGWRADRAVADLASARRRGFYARALFFKLCSGQRRALRALRDRGTAIDRDSPLGAVMKYVHLRLV